MNKFIKNKVFFTLLLIFLVFCIIFGINVSYGAYIRRSYIKAVIATNETEKLFGSNLLYGVKNQPEDPDSDSWLRVYPYTVQSLEEGESDRVIDIPLRIYNYLVEDKDRVNQLDVSYIISFKLNGTPTPEKIGEYSINGNSIQNDVVYYLKKDGSLTKSKDDARTDILAGRETHSNTYTLRMPYSDLSKVSFSVKAERRPNTDENNNVIGYGTDLVYLAARVVPCLNSTVLNATAKGEFTDRKKGNSDDNDAANYVAYNYSINLSGSSSVVELRWKRELLELDPFFSTKFKIVEDISDDKEYSVVAFELQPGISTIQFYRKGDTIVSNWNDFCVSVTAK